MVCCTWTQTGLTQEQEAAYSPGSLDIWPKQETHRCTVINIICIYIQVYTLPTNAEDEEGALSNGLKQAVKTRQWGKQTFFSSENTQSCPPTHLPVICKYHYHFHIPMRSGHISIKDASRHTLKNSTFINTQFTPRLQCWVDAESRMIHGLEDKVFTASQSEATCELVHTGSSFKWMSLWDINRRKKWTPKTIFNHGCKGDDSLTNPHNDPCSYSFGLQRDSGLHTYLENN